MKMNSTKVFVERVLKEVPASRDCDALLIEETITRILASRGRNLTDLSATGVLHLVAEKQLPSLETITRVRRKFQETDVSLRGDNYETRQGLAQENVIAQLKLF